MSSVIDLGGGVIMSKSDAEKLVRAIDAMKFDGVGGRWTQLYEHFQKHDAGGVLMDLQEATRPKEEPPL